ncbi:MAG: agmatinase, partial [Mesorhizobium sp.]
MAWDNERLRALHNKYREGYSGEPFNPKFRRVANKISSVPGSGGAPYAGIPTFLDAPCRPIDPHKPDFGDIQVAIVGMPMDLGVTNRTGASFGPRALRAIERIGPYNHMLDCAPVFDLRVADIGDVPFVSRYRLELCHAD